MRGKTVLLRLMLIVGAIFFANTQLYAQSVVLTEIEIKEDNSAVKILYATNRSIAVECYDLSVPPQIIVDFMGDVYSKEPEVKMINLGVVKQMRAIRGTKTSPDLDETYYPIDFIIIDLKESVRYDFDQGLTTSVLMVSKPGQPKQDAKVEIVEAKVEKIQEEVVADIEVAEEKVAEQPVIKTVEAEQVNAADLSKEQSEINKEPKQKKTFKKKMTGGIKNLFTFGKAKDKTSEQIKAQQEKEAKKQKKEVEKQERTKNAENKKIAGAKKRELGLKKKIKAAPSIKKPESVKVEKKKPMFNPSNQVEAAQKKVNDLNAEILKAAEQLQTADAQVIAAEKDKDTIAERVEFSKAKTELAKDDYDTSLKHMQIAKSAANGVWVEYSNAKAKLSSYLENGTEESIVSEAQKTYDTKKAELENVIKAAEIAKKESDVKLEEYNKLKQESETLVSESQNPAKSVAKIKEDYLAKESNLKNLQDKLAIAMQELETANIALKRYELEKADEEYKKSLNVIDSQIVKQMEAEQEKAAEEKRLAEQARLQKIEEEESAREAELKKLDDEKLAKQASLKKLEDEKQLKEQARLNALETEKAKEAAQIAALKALNDDQKKPTDENDRATSKRAEARPASRKVNIPEKKVVKTENNLRSEVLESAVELRNAGLEMQRNGDFDSAVKYYQQALMQDPKYATVHNDLGILYEQKGLEDKAKMEYLTTLQIDPQYIKAHSNLALLYEKSGDYKKAYYHWKQRVNLGAEDDPWTLKAKQRMQLLENRK